MFKAIDTLLRRALLALALVMAAPFAALAAEMTVYKSPTCGCCVAWIDHVKAHGFTVKAIDVRDVSGVKLANGVTRELASCHTALVDGYVIEGHVPAADIKRLLKERPAVTGLAVPGMPMGSPGMEGPVTQRYNVVSFDKSGKTRVFSRYCQAAGLACLPGGPQTTPARRRGAQ